MRRDLVYPNQNSMPGENIAVKLARQTLFKAKKEKEMPEKQVHRKRCIKCNNLFFKEELADGMCAGCKKSHSSTILPPPQTAEPRAKECMTCDSRTFYVHCGGRVECTNCGSIYQLRTVKK